MDCFGGPRMLFAQLFGQSSKQGPCEVSIHFPFFKPQGDTVSFQHGQTADSFLCGILHLYCDWFMHSDTNYLVIFWNPYIYSILYGDSNSCLTGYFKHHVCTVTVTFDDYILSVLVIEVWIRLQRQTKDKKSEEGHKPAAYGQEQFTPNDTFIKHHNVYQTCFERTRALQKKNT